MPHTRKPLAVTTLPLWINGKPTPAGSDRSSQPAKEGLVAVDRW